MSGKRLMYGLWHDDGGQVLDDVVIIREGADFDVSMHGGVRIVAHLLEQARQAGFEVVTGPAAISAAAEGVGVGVGDMPRWIPRATTETGLRMLLAQPAAWAALEPQHVDVDRLLEDLTLRRLLIPATVAITGAPNVGKSTLANALFGQERSIVADVPGTTRDWVGGVAELRGVPVVLVDTPGRRETADPIEREAIELSRRPVEAADLVIQVLDAASGARADAAGGSVLTIANKCDLAPPPPGILGVSARTGTGIAALIDEIHRRLGVNLAGDRTRAAAWFDPAHRQLLREQGGRAVPEIARRLGS